MEFFKKMIKYKKLCDALQGSYYVSKAANNKKGEILNEFSNSKR